MSSNPETSNWLTESLRLTAFLESPAVDASVTWWQTMFGQPPAVHSVQRIGPVLQQHGPIRDGHCNVTLLFQPSRVDWLMTALVAEGARIEGFPTFDTAGAGLALFRQIFEPWLLTAPAVKRMALGGAFVIPVENKIRGYERIQRWLPDVRLNGENSSDFTYQINRMRRSRVLPSLGINRLSRWSVAKLSGIQIQVSGEANSPPRIIEAPEGLSACRVELDINSSAENNLTFSPENRAGLFHELCDFSTEILERGDIP